MPVPLNLDHIPVPWEQTPSYDLSQLPDPPDDYLFIGRSVDAMCKTRDLSIKELRNLAKIWLWGFDYGPDRRIPILKGLAKVNFWMRPEYQLHRVEDLTDIRRDSGPRLLGYTITPTPLPVSRHYPALLSEDEMRQLGAENYRRPADAPSHVPDHHIFQFLLPPNPPPGSIPDAAQTGGDQVAPGPSVPTAPGVASSQNQSSYSPGFNPNPIREAIEKVMVKFCYKDLERHPHAPSKEPVATRTATSRSDLGIVQVGTHTTVSELRLNPVTFEFDPNGLLFPYRGRGPVWADGSCSIDTTIVIGILTMAGCTNIDRNEGREEQFSEIERAFIQVTNMNWDAFDDKVSIELRHAYYNLLCDHVPDIKRGELVPIWATWAESTRSFAQFHIHYTETAADPCMHCGYLEEGELRRLGEGLVPYPVPGDETGVKMSKLWERAWHPNPVSYSCAKCGAPDGPRRHRIVTQLPSRLCFSTPENSKVLNHTENQVLTYKDINGNIQTALYRWLGGAYYSLNHVRVYWNDSERGEFDLGNLRRYDGEHAGGVIIGNVAPHALDDRVPPDWTARGLPLVIYERIIDPTPDMLHAALEAINDMCDCVVDGKSFLIQHYPWFPEALERRSPFLPLERILPVSGERYYEKTLTPQPDVQQKPTDPNQIVADQIAEWQMQGTSFDFADNPDDTPMTLDPGALQRLQTGENLFSSLNEGPDNLINHPEMWPEAGLPQEGGASNFPNLPKTPVIPGAPRSPYWNWVNLSPKNRSGANALKAKGEKEEEMVTVVNIRDDYLTGPSPYRLCKVPVTSIRAAMQRLSEKQSQSPPKKRKSRLEEIKDDEAPRMRRARQKAAK
jgi:hypothetical protein